MAVILLLEDEIFLQENIADLLELSGHEVHVAANGEQGIRSVQTIPPDIVLCDVMMPVMDGFEFLETLLKNELLKHIPVVFLSARADEFSKRQGLAAGARAYVTKPMKIRELLQVVDGILTA